MMKKYFLVLIGVLSFLQGCDYERGLLRYAIINGTPLDSACVTRAISSVPGITDVRFSAPEYYRGRRHRFDYVAGGLANHLIYEFFSDDFLPPYRYHETRYWNSYVFLNAVPALEDIRKMRPYLIEMDKAIEKACDTEILKHIEEACYYEDCY